VVPQLEASLIPSSKFASVKPGGFLVRQPNGSICLQKARWQRLVVVLALLPALLVLNSCGGGGSTSTTATPSITVSCDKPSVTVNGTSQCTATILNLSSTLYNLEAGGVLNGNPTFGTFDANHKYTAPATVPTNNIVTITAIAQAQTTLTATTTITILPATAISAIDCSGSTPKSGLTVTSGMALACTAADSSGSPISVFWEVNTITGGNATIGLMSPQGNYVAPLIPPAGGTVTITAVSQAVSTETKSVTVNVVFGNAVLQKAFAFSISGRVVSGNTFFARAGSFIAGGDGTLTGVVEDYNQVGQPGGATQLAFTGTYAIGPDGRGTMEFCENINTTCTPAAATAFFRIAVVSPEQAQIIEFSKPNSSVALKVGSGEMDSQDILVFNTGGLAGVYSFNFSGLSSLGTPKSEVGEFSSNGHGTISAGSTNTPAKSGDTPGKIDINSGGEQFLSASTYSISSNGRGIATIGSSSFSFYVVSSSRAKFIETDTSAILVGDAFTQQASPCSWGDNALNGAIVFKTAGTKSGAGITDLVRFTANGTGSVTAGAIDENSGGTVSGPGSPVGGSYGIDACGRGTLSIPTSAPIHTYVFYMISVGNAVIQETTSGVVAHGAMVQPQAGPFTAASLSGSYALSLAGTNAAGTTAGNEEDLLGQLTTSGATTSQSGTITAGSCTQSAPLPLSCVDINNSSSNLGTTQTAVAEAGTYTVTDTTTGRATVTLTTPQNLVLYIVSPTQAFAMVGDDNTGIVAIGSLYKQF
jgi:hypothetical protein